MGSVSWIILVAQLNHKGPSRRRPEGQSRRCDSRNRGQGERPEEALPVALKAEGASNKPQAAVRHEWPLGAEKAKTQTPSEPPEGKGAGQFLGLQNFWPPDCETINLCCFKPHCS